MRFGLGWAALLAVLVGGCGATSGSASGSSGAAPLDPPAFLAEVGAETSVVLRRPSQSIEALEATRQEARGAGRRVATRDVAVALMFASQEAEGREARRHGRRMDRMIEAARNGSRDAAFNAEVDFIELWASFRAGSRAAARRAERYTTRHRQAGALTAIAWMIRGEVAFEAEDYDDAIEMYRFALGQLESPLYGFALLRTAQAHGRAGRAEEARQALSEVERLGCDGDGPALTRRLALAAAAEQGTGTRTDADDVIRPASCPQMDATAGGEEQGWRPQE